MGSVLFRAPLALMLGWMAFTVGFYRLVVLSSRFTAGMLRGESPARSLRGLKRDRKAADPAKPSPSDQA